MPACGARTAAVAQSVAIAGLAAALADRAFLYSNLDFRGGTLPPLLLPAYRRRFVVRHADIGMNLTAEDGAVRRHMPDSDGGTEPAQLGERKRQLGRRPREAHRARDLGPAYLARCVGLKIDRGGARERGPQPSGQSREMGFHIALQHPALTAERLARAGTTVHRRKMVTGGAVSRGQNEI